MLICWSLFYFLFQESVLKLSALLNLSTESSKSLTKTATHQRNICVVLGCIAEKLAGPSSIAILSEGTLNYLIANLVRSFLILILIKIIFKKIKKNINLNKFFQKPEMNPSVILFSLIALEKFAQTSKYILLKNWNLFL